MLNKLVYVQTQHQKIVLLCCWENGERERETVLWNVARDKESASPSPSIYRA